MNDKRQKSEHNLLTARINDEIKNWKEMRGTEIKLSENGSKKELHTYKELKKSIIKPSISSKAITYRETPSSDNRQLFDLKKNIFEKKSKIHWRKASKGGIDISNYEKRNTPNNQYYEIVKPELMAELYHNVNDVNKTDIANYSSTQPMEVNKKYFTKKASNIEDEWVSSKKKKWKVSSRNSYATSSKPSISRKSEAKLKFNRKKKQCKQFKKEMCF